MGACISFFFFLIWSIVDWQCCIRFRHIAESLTHIQVCIIFIVFSCIGYYIEYSSLYCTVGPCWLSILYILASIRWEGNGTPLQSSFLENPMDRGAWWAAVYGVTESDTTEATWQQQQQIDIYICTCNLYRLYVCVYIKSYWHTYQQVQ